ncbi:hypothetical protein [Psychromonas ossibalaenae]|uniref:hypothetical protein n=1 Tax=Psychromonas ossibalaenae TaxID=444922 RepID=UPI000382003D|nr:hypothetical protein [Psychromonas ossibalaenae]
MFKLRGISTANFTTKVMTPGTILFSAIVISLIVLIGYKSWQEYRIYQINKMVQTFPTAGGTGTQTVISWMDNATDEDGYVVERKTDGEYVIIATLNADSTSYVDYASIPGSTSCYRIGSYNQAGTAYSEDYCIDIPLEDTTEPLPEPLPLPDPDDPVEPLPDPDEPVIPGNVSIVSTFIEKPGVIELNGREFYGFKSDYNYNDEFSVDEITDVDFSIGNGSLSSHDSSIFIFQEQGEELENGYVVMNYNELNSFNFSLLGSGNTQVATLYLSLGAWSSDLAGLIINAGDTTELITLPTSYTWHYVKIDIEFEQSTVVTVTPAGTHGGYSGIKVAGLLLNIANDEIIPDEESKPSYGLVHGVSVETGGEIDVSNVKYVASDGQSGNVDFSGAEVTSIDYSGSPKYRDSTYEFVNNGTVVASGYTGMSWKETNAVLIDLKSADDQANLASLYFKAGAWTNDPAMLELTVNGEVSPVELIKGYRWFYLKADIEFEGSVHVELRPVGKLGGYSYISFAGLTLE